MKIADNFFNKVVIELDKKYFPEVKYYMDKKETTIIHQKTELFNNGCISYNKLIEFLSKACDDTKENIHAIVSKYVKDFQGFEYKP